MAEEIKIDTDRLTNYRREIINAKGDNDKLSGIEEHVRNDTELTDEEKSRLLNGIEANKKMAKTEKEVKPLVGDAVAGRKLMGTSKEIDKVKVVGHMVNYTIGNCALPNDVVDDYWNQFRIDEKHKPNKCRLKDAFKNACSDFNKEEEEEFQGTAVKTYWVATQLNPHQYMLTRKIIDKEAEKKAKAENKKGKKDEESYTLSHDNIAKFVMYEVEKETEGKRGKTKKVTGIKFETIEQHGVYKPLAERLHKEMLEKINWYMTTTNDKRVRDATREMIRRVGGINFTSSYGGAWFVPVGGEESVSQFKQFFKFISENYTQSGSRVLMRTFPMIDDYDVKAQIEEDVTAEVSKSMDSLLNRTLNQLRNAENEDEVLGVLAKKLEEHGKTLDLLEKYKDILEKNIVVELDYVGFDEVRTKSGGLSERAKAMLKRMTTSDAE